MGDAARPIRIAVCGASRATAGIERLAETTGRRIAEAGAILICGGLGGVMQAAARGAHEAGGLTVGVLPGTEAHDANPWITVPLPTGMGEGRNLLVVRFADAVIAIGGEWGTLSEIALAARIGTPVVLLRQELAPALPLESAESPEDAVAWALDRARARMA